MRKLLCLLCALLLLPLPGLGEAPALPDMDEEHRLLLEEMDTWEIDESQDPDDLLLNKALPDRIVNILLIGIDSHTKDLQAETTSRLNDVTMVLSIDKETGAMKLTSFLRDTYCTLPRWKSKARLNTAFSKGTWDSGSINGGARLTIRTVNYNWQLNVQRYVLINFYGVASIVDTLGGVDLEMSAAEARSINRYLENDYKSKLYDYDPKDPAERVPLREEDGVQHCDGIQALMYVRIRNLDNDFARTARQRELLSRLLDQVISTLTVPRVLELMTACLPYVYTNITATDMVILLTNALAGALERMGAGEPLLEEHRVPMDHTYHYTTLPDGSSVVDQTFLQWRKNRESVHQFIYGTTEYIKE